LRCVSIILLVSHLSTTVNRLPTHTHTHYEPIDVCTVIQSKQAAAANRRRPRRAIGRPTGDSSATPPTVMFVSALLAWFGPV